MLFQSPSTLAVVEFVTDVVDAELAAAKEATKWISFIEQNR